MAKSDKKNCTPDPGHDECAMKENMLVVTDGALAEDTKALGETSLSNIPHGPTLGSGAHYSKLSSRDLLFVTNACGCGLH